MKVSCAPGPCVQPPVCSLTLPDAFGGTLVVDSSDTIDVGGTAQIAAPARSGRKSMIIANPHASLSLWVSFLGTALANAAGSVEIKAGGALIVTSDDVLLPNAVSIVGAATGQPFTIWEK